MGGPLTILQESQLDSSANVAKPCADYTTLQSETFTPPIQEIRDEYPGIVSTDLSPHGTDGPVGSSFANFQYPVMRQ